MTSQPCVVVWTTDTGLRYLTIENNGPSGTIGQTTVLSNAYVFSNPASARAYARTVEGDIFLPAGKPKIGVLTVALID